MRHILLCEHQGEDDIAPPRAGQAGLGIHLKGKENMIAFELLFKIVVVVSFF
jgi:hypothetical protein